VIARALAACRSRFVTVGLFSLSAPTIFADGMLEATVRHGVARLTLAVQGCTLRLRGALRAPSYTLCNADRCRRVKFPE
jgi:hypothetical protein